mmetsp:Transcript_3031/g.6340  ORF Transcript_3031/g.6340 Transcript_3031/m.6340 type:complete len:234 (-) Transcript_3031:292-993(-)
MLTSASAVSLDSGFVQRHTDSSVLGDLWFFICNTHPLLAVFLSHPQHPHKRADPHTEDLPPMWRVLLHSVAFAFFCSAVAISVSSWHDELPSTWRISRYVAETVSDWPFTLCTSLQTLWDLSGPMAGNYLAPGFDEQPLWWRWSCGMAVLTCSACSLIPSRICTLLGLAVLAICLCLAPVYRAGAPVLAASLQWLQLFLFSKVAAFVLFLPLCSLVYSYLRVRQPRGPKQQIP